MSLDDLRTIISESKILDEKWKCRDRTSYCGNFTLLYYYRDDLEFSFTAAPDGGYIVAWDTGIGMRNYWFPNNEKILQYIRLILIRQKHERNLLHFKYYINIYGLFYNHYEWSKQLVRCNNKKLSHLLTNFQVMILALEDDNYAITMLPYFYHPIIVQGTIDDPKFTQKLRKLKTRLNQQSTDLNKAFRDKSYEDIAIEILTPYFQYNDEVFIRGENRLTIDFDSLEQYYGSPGISAVLIKENDQCRRIAADDYHTNYLAKEITCVSALGSIADFNSLLLDYRNGVLVTDLANTIKEIFPEITIHKRPLFSYSCVLSGRDNQVNLQCSPVSQDFFVINSDRVLTNGKLRMVVHGLSHAELLEVIIDNYLCGLGDLIAYHQQKCLEALEDEVKRLENHWTNDDNLVAVVTRIVIQQSRVFAYMRRRQLELPTIVS